MCLKGHASEAPRQTSVGVSKLLKNADPRIHFAPTVTSRFHCCVSGPYEELNCKANSGPEPSYLLSVVSSVIPFLDPA